MPLVDTFRISADLSARSVTLEDGGRTLRLDWTGEGGISRFDAQFLAGLRPNPDVLPVARTTWDRDALSTGVPQFAVDAVMADDSVLKAYLEAVARYGFCFVDGVPASPEATRAVATRIAYLRETIFGNYWDFTANMEHKDTAYTSMAIGPHTDGTYSFDAPGYQMFHCLAADCTGGDCGANRTCSAPSATDGVKNGGETDIDCGGGAGMMTEIGRASCRERV
jgi:trimethyllysine dioxygenase